MKYFLIVLVALFAVAAAAPQIVTYPGIVGTYPTALGARTVVAGPTVVHSGINWPTAWGWPGVVPTVI